MLRMRNLDNKKNLPPMHVNRNIAIRIDQHRVVVGRRYFFKKKTATEEVRSSLNAKKFFDEREEHKVLCCPFSLSTSVNSHVCKQGGRVSWCEIN